MIRSPSTRGLSMLCRPRRVDAGTDMPPLTHRQRRGRWGRRHRGTESGVLGGTKDPAAEAGEELGAAVDVVLAVEGLALLHGCVAAGAHAAGDLGVGETFAQGGEDLGAARGHGPEVADLESGEELSTRVDIVDAVDALDVVGDDEVTDPEARGDPAAGEPAGQQVEHAAALGRFAPERRESRAALDDQAAGAPDFAAVEEPR